MRPGCSGRGNWEYAALNLASIAGAVGSRSNGVRDRPSTQNVVARDPAWVEGQAGAEMPASSRSVGIISMLSTSAEVRPTHLPPGQPIINGISSRAQNLSSLQKPTASGMLACTKSICRNGGLDSFGEQYALAHIVVAQMPTLPNAHSETYLSDMQTKESGALAHKMTPDYVAYVISPHRKHVIVTLSELRLLKCIKHTTNIGIRPRNTREIGLARILPCCLWKSCVVKRVCFRQRLAARVHVGLVAKS